MPSINQNNQIKIKLALLWTFVCLLLVIMLSCNNAEKKEIAQLDKTLRRVDSIFNRNFLTVQDSDIASLDKAFAAIKNPSILLTAKKNYYKFHYFRDTKGDWNTSMLYVDSNLNLLQAHTDRKDLADLYISSAFYKADIYRDLKNHDEAIRYYTIAKIYFANGSTNPTNYYEYYYNMANILYDQKKYQQAAGFYRLKCETASSKQSPYAIYLVMQENIDNIGMCYAKAGMTDSALYYYQATLNYIDSNKNVVPPQKQSDIEVEKGVVYRNLADIAAVENNYQEAEDYYLKSIAGTKSLGQEFTTPLRLSLAELYLQNNEIAKAGTLLHNIETTLDSSSKTADLYKNLAAYYTKSNQHYAANKALQQSYAIRDSMEIKERLLNAKDVRKDFESREQKNLSLALKKDQQIKQSYLTLFGISTIAAVVIIFFVWFNLHSKSKYAHKHQLLNDELSKKNDDLKGTLLSLQQSHKENDKMMRVVAHDLKTPVSAVRTLTYSLIKKEEGKDDKEALALIEATCADSLTLINNLLSKKRSLAEVHTELVDMGKLIEKCIEWFQEKVDEKKQHISLQLDSLILRVDRQRIWNALSEILNKAIKFNPDYAEILIKLEKKTNRAILSIQQKKNISKPGAEGKVLNTDNPDITTDINNYINTLEADNGKVWFENTPGKGAVFFIELPFSTN